MWVPSKDTTQRSFGKSVPPSTILRYATATLFCSERARDDQSLDLARSLEQRVDLRVPVPLLDREVLDVAVTAEDLDRLLGHADRDLAGLELRHRTLGVLERLT